jgi:hypothetical protein
LSIRSRADGADKRKHVHRITGRPHGGDNTGCQSALWKRWSFTRCSTAADAQAEIAEPADAQALTKILHRGARAAAGRKAPGCRHDPTQNREAPAGALVQGRDKNTGKAGFPAVRLQRT